MKKRTVLKKLGAACALALLGTGMAPALAQQSIKIATVFELTGAGAVAGTNMKNGVDLAVKEINAAGGILGKKIETVSFDTQSNPNTAKAMAQKAAEQDVFAVFGPVFSGSVAVSMLETRRAEIPNFVGAEAANITQQGNPYVFRTSFTQAISMPKVARYMSKIAKVEQLAVVYVNNEFGKGGHDVLLKAIEGKIKVAADIAIEPGQSDYSGAVQKARQATPDAVFVYANEDESARILRELRKQGWNKPVIGETTLIGQKVIDLAGDAANGVVAHVGLTADAPNPAVKAFKGKFEKEYKYAPDHNCMKGYAGMYTLKAAMEKVGKADRKAVAKALHGIQVKVADYPGVLLDVTYDDHGDLNHESFMVEVRKGRQEVILAMPPVAEK